MDERTRNEAPGQKISLSSGIQSFWLNKECFSPELCSFTSTVSALFSFTPSTQRQLAAVNKLFMSNQFNVHRLKLCSVAVAECVISTIFLLAAIK